jgi:hypothetical protein
VHPVSGLGEDAIWSGSRVSAVTHNYLLTVAIMERAGVTPSEDDTVQLAKKAVARLTGSAARTMTATPTSSVTPTVTPTRTVTVTPSATVTRTVTATRTLSFCDYVKIYADASDLIGKELPSVNEASVMTSSELSMKLYNVSNTINKQIEMLRSLPSELVWIRALCDSTAEHQADSGEIDP